MANKTVSNLKEVTTVSNSDVLLVETSTETLKVTKGNLLKEVNEQLSAIKGHSHDNKAVLDKFSENDGELYFGSKKVGSDVEDGSITSNKLADGSIGADKTSFLNLLVQNYFEGDGVVIGEKIISPSNGRYATTQDEIYMISSFIPIINTTTPIELYSYGRIAFFDENKNFIDALGSYSSDNINSSINLSSYSVLSGTHYIKVCIKREYLGLMYVRQDEIELSGKERVNFKSLELTQEQIDYALNNAGQKLLPISSLIEVDVTETDFDYYDGYKIAGNGDSGYVLGRFSLTQKEDATTTGLIPINANEQSMWKLTNVARIAFFDETETYIDSLYDSFNPASSAYPPTTPINIFSKFPTLKNTKFVRLTVRLEYKNNWSLLIDGVEYFQKQTINIPNLNVGIENLSDEVKFELSKTENNSFDLNKDTSIVFKKNVDFASTHFRIPFMCVTNQGTIIAGCDIRYNTWNDHSLIDIGTARSEDGGKTWIDKTVAIQNPGISSSTSRVMDGTILATKEGRIFLIGNKFDSGNAWWTQVNTPNDPNWDCVMYKSDDDGRTWQFHQSLKSLLPNGQISFLGGVGSGIQMKNGTLVFPIQMARANDTPFNCQSGIIYSTDNGESWTMSTSLVPEYTSECSVVEYPTNTIMINCRQEGQNHRSVFSTTDLGTTWVETPMNSGTIQTNACQGHMCKVKVGFDTEVILFTNPVNDGTNREDGAYSGYDRSNLSLSVLLKDEVFKPIHTLYRPHSDGYSCMAFDERRNRLYVVMELDYNLVFKDITDLLPTVQMYKSLENSF